MKFFGIKDLQTKSKLLNQALRREQLVTLTNHGKPYAFVVGTNEDDYFDMLKLWSGMQARQAMYQAQRESVKNGLDKMTLEEINAEINAARRDRKKRARRS